MGLGSGPLRRAGFAEVIVDSSALIAIIRQEADAGYYLDLLEESVPLQMSVANFLEAAIVADASDDPSIPRRFDDLIRFSEIQLQAVTEEQVRVARAAYRDFGRGSGHQARLNFGDCFAYALARSTSEPLLYKGKDFTHTDVKSVVGER